MAEPSAKRGGVVTLSAQVVQLVVGVGAGLALARLLAPADFGLFAVAAVPFGLVATLREFGLSASIVRAAEVPAADLAGLFRLGLRYGLYLALAMLALTPAMAWFYGEPFLWAALPALGLGLLAQSVGVVPLGVLRRRMRFGTVVAAEVVAFATAAAAALTLAWAGAGAWALVVQLIWQQVGVGVLTLALARATTGLRPWGGPATPARGLRAYVTFGWQATASRLVLNFGRAFDLAALGKVATPAATGLYQQSMQWASFPLRQVQSPLVYVAVSGLSDAVRRVEAGEPGAERDYRRAADLGLGLMLAAVLPALSYLAAEAAAVIRVLLGEQWLPAADLLRLLAVALAFAAVGRSAKWVYLAEGRTGPQLRWSFVEAGLTIAGVACGLPWGAVGVAAALAVTNALVGPLAIGWCVRGSVLRGVDVLRAVALPAVAATAAAAAAWGIGELLALPAATFGEASVRCLVTGGTFAVAYVALMLAAPPGRGMARALLRRGA